MWSSSQSRNPTIKRKCINRNAYVQKMHHVLWLRSASLSDRPGKSRSRGFLAACWASSESRFTSCCSDFAGAVPDHPSVLFMIMFNRDVLLELVRPSHDQSAVEQGGVVLAGPDYGRCLPSASCLRGPVRKGLPMRTHSFLNSPIVDSSRAPGTRASSSTWSGPYPCL